MMFTQVFDASKHDIKCVTVSNSSKAEIVRTFSLDIKKGLNRAQIMGISGTLDTQFVRVSGVGSARVIDVACTFGEEEKKSTSDPAGVITSEAREALILKKRNLERMKALKEQQLNRIGTYAQTLTSAHVNPTQLIEFYERYDAQGSNTVSAIASLEEQIAMVERSLHEADKINEPSEKLEANNSACINIVLFTEEDDTTIDVEVAYVVKGASWKPAYELYVSTKDGKSSPSISLLYHAVVTQETGEDWNNAELTINTRSFDTAEESVPDLKQRKIYAKGIWQPFKPPVIGIGHGRNEQGPRPQVMPRGPTFTFSTSSENKPSEPSVSIFGNHAVSSTSQIQRDTAAAPGDTDFEKVERAPLITENKIVVSETPASFFFSIEGKFSIPSDGVAHQVSVAKLTPSAKVIYATTPRIDPRVFVQCEVTNDSEYPILPGPVMVVFDNRFISKTSIQKEVNKGDSFECFVGEDTLLKVTYLCSSKTIVSDGGSYAEASRTTKYTTEISVHNKHQFAIDNLVISEALPTTDDQRLKVFLRKPDGLAEAKGQ
ncbi:hypothetical protein D9613_009802 [Agrocybe pediades]|uniref:Protein F37C4.5 n=1 Tax=Agrocybe pediades TaxID=84607 RepID=A0A8H4QXZ6_9AGAR|nr:hypothetical protein D9613_009802 [Agrocybe pediades]